MAKNRYVGDYPVIGIRPCIDGRRGPMMLRESLEEQTMALARAAKKLFEENLFYSNGDPVKAVQDVDMVDTIPEDVKEKLLRFGRAAVAVATMRGKSYLQIGSQCMGIAGAVCMHNVPEGDIFRPACWNAFGMDKEGQDFRTCTIYGLQFKK